MLPGPVFQFELLTTARRGRFYLIRVGYGLALLLVLYVINESWLSVAPEGQVLSVQQVARFAFITFVAFSLFQVVMVLALTPVLVAGTIVDEKQRKTLHYLLASQLTGAEIVLGKALARLLHILVFLAVGLPITSLLNLLGGVDPRMVLLSTAAAVSTALFLAGVAILFSVLARRVRDAVFTTYIAIVAWLTLPFLFQFILPRMSAVIPAWVTSINDAVMATNPLAVLWLCLMGGATGTPAQQILRLVGLQTACGLALLAVATLCLRRVYAAAEDAPRRLRLTRAFGRMRLRLWPRFPVGDYPMLWKELFTARPRGLVRRIGQLIGLAVAAAFAYGVGYFAVPAFYEVILHGYAYQPRFETEFWLNYQSRRMLNEYLQFVSVLLYLAWTFTLAGAAAGSVTSEREQDTWTSLTTTTLSGPDIVLAKMLGALWSTRWLGGFLLLIWLVGTAAGGIHPLGLLLATAEVASFLLLTAAAGTWISMSVGTSSRAQVLTVGFLVLFNGLGQTVLYWIHRSAPAVWPLCAPVLLPRALLTYETVASLAHESLRQWRPDWDVNDTAWGPVLLGVASLLVDLTVAAIITGLAIGTFQVAAGRPRRASRRPRCPDEGCEPAHLAATTPKSEPIAARPPAGFRP